MLEINILSRMFSPLNSHMPKLFWEYVQKPSRSGIIAALRTAIIRSKLSSYELEVNIFNRFACITETQRDNLFDYFSNCEPPNTLTGKEFLVIIY
jgi:hypothetical protein